MKNIIVAVLTLVIFGLMAMTYSNGGAYQGGELGKVIKDIKSTQEVVKTQVEDTQKEEDDKLKALQNKAGSIGKVKVSKAYKTKCAACHGADGSGLQNGKKLMGPKLYGQEADKLYKDLIDFKAGRKENVIMKGLLIHLDEPTLRKFADEIGGFSTQSKD